MPRAKTQALARGEYLPGIPNPDFSLAIDEPTPEPDPEPATPEPDPEPDDSPED